jgi:hypothetical protein
MSVAASSDPVNAAAGPPGDSVPLPACATGSSRAKPQPPCLAAALDYLARGWPALALCPPDHAGVNGWHEENCNHPGKVPCGRYFQKWLAYKDRLPGAKTLRLAWAENPRYNVGVATGPLSFLALDVEGAGGEGFLARELGELPVTPEFLTGKGRRLLFAWPAGLDLSNEQYTFGPDDELRVLCKGRQTAMPPSVHESGAVYKWRQGRGPELPLAPPPPRLLELLQGKAAPKAEAPRPAPVKLDGRTPDAVLRAAAYVKAYPSGTEGQDASGNAFALACRLTRGFGLDDETALRLMLHSGWNDGCRGKDGRAWPWAEKELRHKLDGARKAPEKEAEGYLLNAPRRSGGPARRPSGRSEGWQAAGGAEGPGHGERDRVWHLLERSAGPLSVQEISAAMEQEAGATANLLEQMVGEGAAQKVGDGYAVRRGPRADVEQDEHGDAWEGEPAGASTAQAAADEHDTGEYALGELLDRHPNLRPPVVHGLLRQGETMNVIAPSKVGKSWLVIDLALAAATGGTWLGGFRAERGEALILDNELHPETLADRLRKVAEARGIDLGALRDRITVKVLRGRLRDILSLRTYLDRFGPGRFKLIILDTLYRMLPADVSESGNAEMAGVYNVIDSYADRLGCSFVAIHHASKGNQADKAVTDVGSGAGSMSRAADSHLILRQHEEDGVYVLEAAVRSWAPVEPQCLRWQFPVWEPERGLSPDQLRRPEEKRREARRAVKTSSDDAQLLVMLDRLDPGRQGYGVNRVREELSWDYRRMNGAITRLVAHDLLERCRAAVDIGCNGTREVDGIRRPSVQD